MNLDEYQAATGRTWDQKLTHAQGLGLVGLGVAGEAGEVSDEITKVLFHGRPLDAAKLALELGDVLWYVARGAAVLGLTLDQVAQRNLEKLQARYQHGWVPGQAKMPAQAPAQPEPRSELPPAKAPEASPPPPAPPAPPPAVVHVPADTPAKTERLVRVKADIPPFVGPDQLTRQLKAGDLATVPESLANLLVRRGKAELVEATA